MDERIECKLATNNKENVYKSGGSLSHEKVPASESNRNWVMKGITKLKPDSKERRAKFYPCLQNCMLSLNPEGQTINKVE